MRESQRDHSLPVFVTLLVLSFLLMTFDVRTDGAGMLGAVRGMANTVVQPIEQVTGAVVDPVANFIDGVSNIAGLRDENEALRALVAEREAELAAVEDQLERLATLERRLGLELAVGDLAEIDANVTGRNDSFDLSFRIDKGTNDGVLADQPVVDENGFLVGKVLTAWATGATVMPITADVEAVAVNVEGIDGIVESVPGSDELQLDREMELDVFASPQSVAAGDRVVTSQFSTAFPPLIPVGEIIEDADPVGQSLTARVRPYFDLSSLRIVVVVVWPPDVAAAVQDDAPVIPDTSTTLPGTETTVPGTTSGTGVG
jgi:rod shape-determining protein MreC